MSKERKLTELLNENPPDIKKFKSYSRSKKSLDISELIGLVTVYQEWKEKHNSLVNPLQVACCVCTNPEIVRTLVNEGWSVNSIGNEVLGSPLTITLENGKINIARLLIELGADVRALQDGNTPMFFALRPEKKEKTCIAAVKLLLDAGVSFNDAVDRYGQKPIHTAVLNKLCSVVSFLLQKGADPNVTNDVGQTPLHIAVLGHNLDIVKLLLLHGVDLYFGDRVGDTPLQIAVKEDAYEIVKELAKSGCDVNRSILNGGTSPFHTAVYLLRLDIVKLLVSFGANVNAATINGTTPLHVLVAPSLINVLKKNKKDNAQIRKDLAEYLVDNGALLSSTDRNLNTPLQVAIDCQSLSLAKFFIKLGADVNIRERDGNTIFHLVASLNRDIIILFLEFGGDYGAYNKDRLTPYHIAISQNVDLKYIKGFVKHGCPYDQDFPKSPFVKLSTKQNKINEKFFTLQKKFFKGIKENNLEQVKRCVMDGAVASGCCEDMKYPLHFVALNGYNDLLTFLLEENVQPNTLNNEGKTPLYMAAANGHYDTCRILLRYGACYDYRSEKCPKTPRMIASELKHNAVVDLLDNIEVLFRKARSKKKHAVKFLESKLSNSFEYLMFVSVTNIKGNTVLTTALQCKQNYNAEELLKLKLRYSLGSIE